MLFDLWKLVKDRSGSVLLLDKEPMTLDDFKEVLLYLDRTGMGDASMPFPVFNGKKGSLRSRPGYPRSIPFFLNGNQIRCCVYHLCRRGGGLDGAVRTLRETVELPLKHPEVLRRLGEPPTGAFCYMTHPDAARPFWPGRWPTSRARASSRSAALS